MKFAEMNRKDRRTYIQNINHRAVGNRKHTKGAFSKINDKAKESLNMRVIPKSKREKEGKL